MTHFHFFFTASSTLLTPFTTDRLAPPIGPPNSLEPRMNYPLLLRSKVMIYANPTRKIEKRNTPDLYSINSPIKCNKMKQSEFKD